MMRGRRWAWVWALPILVSCGAATPSSFTAVTAGALQLSGAYIRPAAQTGASAEHRSHPNMQGNGGVAGMFVVITNTGSTPDTLLDGTTTAAETVAPHETTREGNFTKMVAHPEGLAVPANGTLVFEPGANHLMLTSLTQNLTVGMQVSVTLRFQQAGAVTLQVPVREKP